MSILKIQFHFVSKKILWFYLEKNNISREYNASTTSYIVEKHGLNPSKRKIKWEKDWLNEEVDIIMNVKFALYCDSK